MPSLSTKRQLKELKELRDMASSHVLFRFPRNLISAAFIGLSRTPIHLAVYLKYVLCRECFSVSVCCAYKLDNRKSTCYVAQNKEKRRFIVFRKLLYILSN